MSHAGEITECGRCQEMPEGQHCFDCAVAYVEQWKADGRPGRVEGSKKKKR